MYCNDIADATGLTNDQIKSAIYNARQNNPTLREEIEVIASGRVWRYRPVPKLTSTPVAPVAVDATPPETNATPPATPPKPATTRAMDDASRSNANVSMLYQEVGRLNGNVIVRDENGQCYKIEPINLELS